ncbi:MAG TPA: hypothetical protein PK364_01240 [Synergistaceae bacterium]|nr:hypothetical protein [Synergistaceae bacterium]HPJ25912.1 hypothetical protein [Synergistaceae bacterium]HPQ36086.1 hypothetical protein [Synergistaceae bacterium]
MHGSTPEELRASKETSSGMDNLLDEYRKDLEEDLARKIAEKEREYREGIVRLNEMAQKTFEIVEREEERKITESQAFEEGLRNSCASVRRLLYEKAMDPLRIQQVTHAIWPQVIGEEKRMKEEGGESS